MFLAVGVLAVGASIWAICREKSFFRVNVAPLAALLGLSVWALISFFLTDNNVKIFAVWILATFLPLLFLFVSSYLFWKEPEAAKYLYYSCTIWVVVMAVVAFMEVWLGLSHPINRLPIQASGEGIGSRYGIGDYTVISSSTDTSIGISGIFRPTSIFLSNGKFGQALFTLVLYRWIFLYRGKKPLTYVGAASIMFDLLALAISGQRAAFVMLSIFIGFVVASGVIRGNKRALSFLGIGGLLGGFGLVALLVSNPQLADLMTDRYVSGFTDISQRIIDNVIDPSATISQLYGLVGAGPGFYSLGAQKFGGTMMWEVLSIQGSAEGSWLRILAELGVSGLVLAFCYYIGLISQGLERIRSSSDRQNICLYAVVWLSAIACWGITHDTLANAFGMSLGFGLCGAAFTQARKSRAFGSDNARSDRRRPNELTRVSRVTTRPPHRQCEP
jgi:hypothetical protein